MQAFLKKQHVLSIATADEYRPWICNVYFVNEGNNFYFLSGTETRHALHMAKNKNIAFTTVWYDPDKLNDRKSVQAEGKGKELQDLTGIRQAATLYGKKYKRDTEELMASVTKVGSKARFYVLTASYIKYWDDSAFGEEVTREFTY